MAINQPNLEPVLLTNGRTGFRVETDWRYIWSSPSRRYGLLERELRVPAGFLHDGASVPRLLWTPLGLTPAGLTSGAGLAHDVFYRHHGALPHGWMYERPAGAEGWVEVENAIYTRERADVMFHRMLVESGVRWFQAWLAFVGVRWFGWHAWNQQRVLEEAAEE